MPTFLSNLLEGLIEDLSWRRRRIEERYICAILWSLCAVEAPDRHYLVVGFRVLVARQRWWRIEEKLTSTRDTERSYVLPLKRDSDLDSIHNWATRCSLPFSRNNRPGDLELWGRRSVVSTQSNHGQSCGFTRRRQVVPLEFGGAASLRELVAGAGADSQSSPLVSAREAGCNQDYPRASWCQRNALSALDPATSWLARRTLAVGIEAITLSERRSRRFILHVLRDAPAR